jgi:hypothetical protein
VARGAPRIGGGGGGYLVAGACLECGAAAVGLVGEAGAVDGHAGAGGPWQARWEVSEAAARVLRRGEEYGGPVLAAARARLGGSGLAGWTLQCGLRDASICQAWDSCNSSYQRNA